MSSCENKLPFPEAERVTFVTLENVSGFTSVSVTDDHSTQITIEVRLHKYGGDVYEKVEICVVRNPAPTTTNPAFQNAVLKEITSGLSIEDPLIVNITLGEVIASVGALTTGVPIGFYYNVVMPNGFRSDGWLPPPTLYTARLGIHNIDRPAAPAPPTTWVHNFNISVTD